MNPQQNIADIGIEFMKRVNLTGEEVAAWSAFNNWLTSMSRQMHDHHQNSQVQDAQRGLTQAPEVQDPEGVEHAAE